MKKLKLTEMTKVTQGHTSKKWRSCNFNRSLTQNPMFLQAWHRVSLFGGVKKITMNKKYFHYFVWLSNWLAQLNYFFSTTT